MLNDTDNPSSILDDTDNLVITLDDTDIPSIILDDTLSYLTHSPSNILIIIIFFIYTCD